MLNIDKNVSESTYSECVVFVDYVLRSRISVDLRLINWLRLCLKTAVVWHWRGWWLIWYVSYRQVIPNTTTCLLHRFLVVHIYQLSHFFLILLLWNFITYWGKVPVYRFVGYSFTVAMFVIIDYHLSSYITCMVYLCTNFFFYRRSLLYLAKQITPSLRPFRMSARRAASATPAVCCASRFTWSNSKRCR